MEKVHSGKTQTKLVPRIWTAPLASDPILRGNAKLLLKQQSLEVHKPKRLEI